MAKDILNLLIYKIHDKALAKKASTYFKGELIDIGCGLKPYKLMCAPFVTKHLGIDHLGSMHGKTEIDSYAIAYNLPFKNDTFDSALSTCVLEHLEEPQIAINECFRVLKPGGYAIFSVPFIWHLHEEPRDFFRYSKYGLEYIFKKADFEIIEIDALSGFWVTFGQLLMYNLYRFNRSIIRILHLMDIIALFVFGFVYLLEKIDKTEKWTWCYLLVAKKPEVN
jgi:SAM-dependent methyltransferase